MPLSGAVPVTLAAAERTMLKKRACGAKTAYRDRLRAQIVLAAARGRDNARIAADLRVTVDTVRKWRGRFAARGLAGLADLPRSGRPRRISELTRAAVVALACQLPAATGIPLSRWTGPELLAEVTRAGAADELSASSVLRILAEHPVKSWQYRSWTCTRGSTKARGSSQATGSCRSTPSPPSRPAAAAVPPHRPHAARRYESSTNTSGTAPWPAGRPGRAHRESIRRHPARHRHRPVHGPHRPGHDPAGVQGRTPSVRHRG